MMHAPLNAFRTVLGLCVRSQIAVESNAGSDSALFIARWACGCIACGLGPACLTHLPCSGHEQLWSDPPERECVLAACT
jgi:hypothetical protein